MPDFHEEMDRLQGHLPGWAGRRLTRLRDPRAVWVRVPAGIALTGGGVFSVLPVLGLWMLPVGLALLAHDVPPMRRPLARVLNFTNGTIEKRKARKAAKTPAKAAGPASADVAEETVIKPAASKQAVTKAAVRKGAAGAAAAAGARVAKPRANRRPAS